MDRIMFIKKRQYLINNGLFKFDISAAFDERGIGYEDFAESMSEEDLASHLYVTEAYYFNPKQIRRQ